MPFRERYFGDKPDVLHEARERGRQVDAGLGDYEEYLVWLARAAGTTVAETRRQIEHNVPNEKLFAYIAAQLRPKYKLGILSNAGDNWLDEIFTPEQLALFDATALSYETGFVKPVPEAYEAIATKLGVQTPECVFLDDLERYCTGAVEAGMQAVYYRNFEQARRDLETLLAGS